jgi:hypothetical protein
MCSIQSSLTAILTASHETLRRASRTQENVAHFLRCRRAGSDSAAHTDPGPDVLYHAQCNQPNQWLMPRSGRLLCALLYVKGQRNIQRTRQKRNKNMRHIKKMAKERRLNSNESKHSEGFVNTFFKIKNANFFSSKTFYLLHSLRTKRNAVCLKPQSVPRSKHLPSRLLKPITECRVRQNSLFILRSTQNICTGGRMEDFGKLHLVVHTVTTRL